MNQAIIAFLLTIFVVGCGQDHNQQEQMIFTPVSTFVATGRPTPTIVPTLTLSRPTQTPEPSLTPYPTPKPYLIKLFQHAGDGVDEIHICRAVYSPFPRFVLYEDGQLIYYHEGKLLESFLTDGEITNLLGKIEATGYFEIGDSFEDYYVLPSGIQYGEGGWGVGVSVKGKDVGVHPELTQYLVQPIKDTVSIIQTYQPTGNINSYFPEKIELWASTIDQGYFSTPEPSAKVADWLTELPPLNLYWIKLNESETEILKTSNYFSGVPEVELFRQDGITYWVLACPPWYGY